MKKLMLAVTLAMAAHAALGATNPAQDPRRAETKQPADWFAMQRMITDGYEFPDAVTMPAAPSDRLHRAGSDGVGDGAG
jgi:hypothetical protein